MADVGLCLSSIGEFKQALTLSTTALQGTDAWRVRSQSIIQTYIATHHLSVRRSATRLLAEARVLG